MTKKMHEPMWKALTDNITYWKLSDILERMFQVF